MANIVIKLAVPIDTPEKDGVSELIFKRRMNARDLSEIGFRLDLAGDGGMHLDADQINTVACNCTGIPKRCLENLDAADWLEVFKTVTSFFSKPAPTTGG